MNGVRQLTKIHPELEIILLDDAYQHRAITPSINILITEFNNLYTNDYMMPSGRLRESTYESKRANIIIVSKCPTVLSPLDRRRVIEELAPRHHQTIYFSYIKYKQIIPFTLTAKNESFDFNNLAVLLVTGIANPEPLYYKIKNTYKTVEHLSYNDHHSFSEEDVILIKKMFNKIIGNNKLIITTEKDIMRLSLPKIKELIYELPIFYMPIEIDFHNEDKKAFNNQIINYVRENTSN